MSIQNIIEKIKGFVDEHRPNIRIIPDDLFLGLIIILVAFGSFGLGRLSKIEGSKTPIRIENAPEITADTFSGKVPADTEKVALTLTTSTSGEGLVGSKNGTKYYYPWCSGVSKISPANLIHFVSKSEAESRGYTASATCKGL
ncbi:MAG: hypothetical protein Q7K40_05690 [bacterium]|nr:hypothetical protein [bacterium]